MSLIEIVIIAIEILGTAAFSLSGTLLGIDKGLDFLGVMVLGATTAVGGGIMRDIILGNTPPAAFTDPKYIFIALFVSVIAILWAKKYIQTVTSEKLAFFMVCIGVLDAMGLGLFTVIGIDTAIAAGHQDNLFLLIFIGVITGVGGGVMRDVFVNKTPLIFKRNIYATASIIGGLIYYFALQITSPLISIILGSVSIMIIRFIAMYYDLNLPTFGDDYYD